MAKAEWGLKRICPSCSGKYYDMRKNPPVCPSCGTKFDPEALLKSRRIRASGNDTKREAPKRVAPKLVDPELAAVAEDDIAVEAIDPADDKAGEGLIEDTADLGDEEEEVVAVEGDE